MKKILILLSLVFVFSISCEDDIIEIAKEIEAKEVGGESVNFDDIDTYELGDLVDLQINIVLPAGSKVAASDFQVSTFVSDKAQVINSEAGYVVMAENSGGETMLLGYTLPPTEVKSSLAMKNTLVKSKATYNNSEISCRSTILSLVMMSLGKLEGIPSADALEKVLAHAEFNQLVAKFTDKFNNDPIFLEKINEDKEIKDQIKKLAKEVLSLCITEIVSTTKSKSTTKSSGLIQDFNWMSAWDKYEPWTWHGEANWYNVYDAPFLAICEKSNVPLKEKLAIANPANINYIADFYDESGKFQDYRFIGRNSTLIQKAIHSGASQTTVLTDVDFVDGFDPNKTYKVVIKKCFFKDQDELRHKLMSVIHLLRITESTINIIGDGEVLNMLSLAMQKKTVVKEVVETLASVINSVNNADLSSTANISSILETGVELIGKDYLTKFMKKKALKLMAKSGAKVAAKTSNPAGWAIMVFEAVNDFAPMIVSFAAPDKMEYTFNLAQNKIYDNNAPTITIANISPNNGQTKVDNPATFVWNGSAKEYQLLMWATDDPSDIIHFPKSAAKTQTANSLDFGKKYKWQVTAYGEDGYSVKGDIWEFTMANGENQKPSKPVAMYPLGLSEEIPTSMRFEWTKSTDPNPSDLIQYKLTYFYEKNGKVAEKFEKIIEKTHFDAKLKAGQTYYWNVIAIDDRGAQALGNHYAFETVPNTAPSTPVLISPTDNSTDLETTVEFSWNASSDVDEDNLSYEITVLTSNGVSDGMVRATTQNTSYSFKLGANTAYTWYITADDNNGGKTKSDVWSFTTVETSSGSGIKSGNFAITSTLHDGSEDWGAIIQQTLGSDYRMADWNDLKAYYNNGDDLLNLFDNLGLEEYNNSVAVTFGGDKSRSSTRYYFASRHEGNVPSYYAVHDYIGSHVLSLGSWSGSRKLLAVKKNPEVSIEMVSVQGGTFQMGSNDGDSDEKPIHSVTLSSFEIGKYEVTQAQWEKVMGSNPSNFKGVNLPVEEVSWNDIQTFITKLNEQTGLTYRLPTEAEWEFAARGGNSSNGYIYAGSNTIGDVAWYSSNSSSKTHDVGGKKANELGIYDMSGNVWEWCNDWKGSYGSDAVTNPTGPTSGSNRVNRGGTHLYFAASLCRVAFRYGAQPRDRTKTIGFRLARSL